MCLLSVFRPGAPVVRDHIAAGTFCNPDGFGFAVIVGDRIEIGKGMDADAVMDAFIRVRDTHPDGWAMFHSRLTTDGDTSEDNCHPFVVGNDPRTVLGHNGILPKEARPRGKDSRSDTRILAETLIPGGMFGRIRGRIGRRKLEKWIGKDGYPNKVAILTVDPRYRGNAFILGESRGTWVGDVWHSNDGYLPYIPRYPRSSSSGMSAEYAAYLRGEVSYADYVDALFTGKSATLTADQCPMCRQRVTVNMDHGYCTACKVCIDCGDDLAWCQCYSGTSGGYPASELADSLPMALADLGDTPGSIDWPDTDTNGPRP